MRKRYEPRYDWSWQAAKHIRHPLDRPAVMRELDDHIEDMVEAYTEAGLPPEEARQKAIAAMGDPDSIGRQLAALHKPWLHLLQISNSCNFFFSLFAYLPLFLFPLKYGIGQKLIMIGFAFLLLFQLFFNRGPQLSGAQDPHGKAMEKISIRVLNTFTPIAPRGAHAGVGLTGPTQNLQVTDSQRAQLASWLLIFGLWFTCLVGLSDAHYGVAADLVFADYIPLFLGLSLTAGADFLLANPKGGIAKYKLLAAAILGLLMEWGMLLVV